MSSSQPPKQDGDKIQFKELLAACAAGDNTIADLLSIIMDKRPDSVPGLLNHVLTRMAEIHQPKKYRIAPGQEKTMEEVMHEGDVGNLTVMHTSVRSAAGTSDERLALSRLKAELMCAMFEYAISHDDNNTTSKFVALIRDHGPMTENVFLDRMERWAANSLTEKFRVYTEQWIRVFAKKIDTKLEAEEAESIKLFRDELLQAMNKVKRTVYHSESMSEGIAVIISSPQFQYIKQYLPIAAEMLDQFTTHLATKFDDTEFQIKLLAYTNDEVFTIAKKLESCLTIIDMISDAVNKNTEMYSHTRLVMLRQLQTLRESVLTRKQQIAGEMFQRLHYINADVIPNLNRYTRDVEIVCATGAFNTLKYKLIKGGKLKEGDFWAVKKKMFEATMVVVADGEQKIDIITPGKILRYMLYIAEFGTESQRQAVKNMLPAVIKYIPSSLTSEIINEAKEKKIFTTQPEYEKFCMYAELFYHVNPDISRTKVFAKIVSLSVNKHDFEDLMAASKIENPFICSLFDRLFLSDVTCGNILEAHSLVHLILKHIDRDAMTQDLIVKILADFPTISDKELFMVLGVLVYSGSMYGQKLSPMFHHNCLQGAESCDHFLLRERAAVDMLQRNKFLNKLYNHMESHHIAGLYARTFGDNDDDEPLVDEDPLITQIRKQQRPIYMRSMNVAAVYLDDVMKLQSGRDEIIQQIMMYVAAINDFAGVVVSPKSSGLSVDKGEEVFNLLLSITHSLKSHGLQDMVDQVVIDVTVANTAKLVNDDVMIKMRATFLYLLDFITSTRDITFDHSTKLSSSVFALYRKVKSAKDQVKEERTKLLACIFSVSDLLEKSADMPRDTAKLKSMLTELLQKNSKSILSAELNEFAQQFNKCLLVNEPLVRPRAHAHSEPASISNARNPVFARNTSSVPAAKLPALDSLKKKK